FSTRYGAPRALPSFPTRRSSDLPLRDRCEDIPMLVQHFLSRVGPAEARSRITGISAGALAMLKAYDWPGNIRQLENAVFRAVVRSEEHTSELQSRENLVCRLLLE